MSLSEEPLKYGYLKKYKGKKRFAILRRLSAQEEIQVVFECYENEKRWKQQQPPKLCINTSQLFNVNKLALTKQPNVLVVYTVTDTYLFVCENAADLDSWHQAVLNVFEERYEPGKHGLELRRNFEYCWDTMVTRFDGGTTGNCPRAGVVYRFCLTDDDVFLVRRQKSSEEALESWQFELAFVPSYGLQGDIFYLTLGRSTVTGHGQLFMKFDDLCVAQCVYKTLQRVLEERKHRRKSVSDIKKSGISTQRRSTEPGRDRSASLAASERQRGFSESEKSLKAQMTPLMEQQQANSKRIPSSEALESSMSRSFDQSPSLRPPSVQGVSLPSSRHCSSESMASTSMLSEDGHPMPPHTVSPHIIYGKSRCASVEAVCNPPPIKEESSGGEYLPMQPPSKSSQNEDSYTAMHPSSCSATPRYNDNEYTFMAAKDNAGGYTEMAPGAKPYFNEHAYRHTQWNLEEVRSYISDSGESCGGESISSRSYSLGARPAVAGHLSVTDSPTAGNYVAAQTGAFVMSNATSQQQDDRRRANSFGNWSRPKKITKYRRHFVPVEHTLSSQMFDSGTGSRPRSESFSSSGSNRGRARRVQDGSRQYSHHEDLVEFDFGSSPIHKSPASSSLGSSESLNRSRTGSLVSGAQRSWSPKVELIEESNHSPSGRLVAGLTLGGSVSSVTGSGYSEYVPMFLPSTATTAASKPAAEDRPHIAQPQTSPLLPFDSKPQPTPLDYVEMMAMPQPLQQFPPVGGVTPHFQSIGDANCQSFATAADVSSNNSNYVELQHHSQSHLLSALTVETERLTLEVGVGVPVVETSGDCTPSPAASGFRSKTGSDADNVSLVTPKKTDSDVIYSSISPLKLSIDSAAIGQHISPSSLLLQQSLAKLSVADDGFSLQDTIGTATTRNVLAPHVAFGGKPYHHAHGAHHAHRSSSAHSPPMQTRSVRHHSGGEFASTPQNIEPKRASFAQNPRQCCDEAGLKTHNTSFHPDPTLKPSVPSTTFLGTSGSQSTPGSSTQLGGGFSPGASTSMFNCEGTRFSLSGSDSNSIGGGSPVSSSTAAEGSLEYVTLDLPRSFGGAKSPMKSPTGSLTSMGKTTAAADSNDDKIAYAQIDATKSEAVKNCARNYSTNNNAI